MPYRRGIGRELTRSTICVKRSRASVTLMCSDRIPVGPAELFVAVDWTNFVDDVVLTFRGLNGAGGGDVRFGAANGSASMTIPGRTRQLVRITGARATAGADPDVRLDVQIEGQVIDSLPLSVGPPVTSLAVLDGNGVGPATDVMLPNAIEQLRAVPTPAGAGTVTWLSAVPSILTVGTPSSTGQVAVTSAADPPTGSGAPAADAPVALCVFFAPASGPGVMAVHRVRTLFHPENPGPFPVGRTEYSVPDDLTIPAGIEGSQVDVNVSVQALVRYPAVAAGVDTAVSAARPTYPLVILAHGRHVAAEFVRKPDGSLVLDLQCDPTSIRDGAGRHPEFANHEGLEYLASHLASHGFIAISVNLNGKFDPVTGTGQIAEQAFRRVTCHEFDQVGIAHRGLTILHHALEMESRNSAGPLFTDRIDLERVGLLGHSRGGEAVVDAADMNRQFDVPGQVRVKAVVSLAPTDFRGINVTVPYLVIIGSDDGDVRNVQGLRIYDRADPPKYLVWLTGGIHNFFSSVWHWQDEVDALPSASRRQHQDLAQGYATVFFHAHLLGLAGHRQFFTGERRLAGLAGTDLHHAIQLPGATVVDHFEDAPADPARNTLTQPVTSTALAATDEVYLNVADRNCAAGVPFWFHDTSGVRLEWTAAGGRYVSNLGGLDVRNQRVLSFRVGQDATGNPSGNQDFVVRLTDGGGRAAVVRVGEFATIPPARRKSVIDRLTVATCVAVTRDMTISWLKTVRIPLARFQRANSRLDLARLASVTFEFTETSSGRLAFDNVEFSQ